MPQPGPEEIEQTPLRYAAVDECASLGTQVGIDSVDHRVVASAPFLNRADYSCPDVGRYHSHIYRISGTDFAGGALPGAETVDMFDAISVGETMPSRVLDMTGDGVADPVVSERGHILILDGATWPSGLDDVLDLGEGNVRMMGVGDIDGDLLSDVMFEAMPNSLWDYGVWWKAGPYEQMGDDLRLYPTAIIDGLAGGPIELTDLDGDGVTDALIGTPQIGDGAGGLTVLPSVVDAVDASGVIEMVADAGAGVAAVGGDVDGDGVPEVASGAQLYGGRSGRAWIASGAAIAPGSLDDLAAWRFTGTNAGDFAGFAIAMDDLDGDGLAEIIVAEPFDPYDPAREPGRVAVLLSPVAPGDFTDADAEVILRGASGEGDLFGGDLATGDLDGDAAMDLVVGAPDDPEGGPDAGSVTLFMGKNLVP